MEWFQGLPPSTFPNQRTSRHHHRAGEDSVCRLLMILTQSSPRLSGSAFYPFREEGCGRNTHFSPMGIQLLNNLPVPWGEETLCFSSFFPPPLAVVTNEWWCAKSLTGRLPAHPHKSSRLLWAGPRGKRGQRFMWPEQGPHRPFVWGNSSLQMTVCGRPVDWLLMSRECWLH